VFGIYIHWPFCLSLCPYCDFNSFVSQDVDHNQFLINYKKQIDYFCKKITPKKITSIYFGGGTPSLMKPEVVGSIIDYIKSVFSISKDVEITLEVNPTSFEIAKIKKFYDFGVNRLSIGVQSFNDVELLFLGRKHSAKQAITAIEQCSKIFDNYTVDLIYATARQSVTSWVKQLDFALTFNIPHLSLYTLTIEEGTPFYEMFQKGKLKVKSSEEVADFFDATNNTMQNFLHYEISSYAKNKQYQSQHNLLYWQLYDYIAIGPGSHARLFYNDGKRYQIESISKPKEWLKSENKLITEKQLTVHEQIQEILLAGLRTIYGVNIVFVERKFSINLIDYLDKNMLTILIERGLISLDKECLRLTQNGFLLLNSIIRRLYNKI
jgi:putative oxygen-independent coproporphyrinogen III oxidase